MEGETVLGTGTLAAGVASIATTSLDVGVHEITVVYAGDENFAGSVSTGIQQTVHKADATVAVVSSVNPSVVGESVTFTATLTPATASAGTPTGTVTFVDGSTAIGLGVLDNAGVATFTAS